jgi:hypothetical protein
MNEILVGVATFFCLVLAAIGSVELSAKLPILSSLHDAKPGQYIGIGTLTWQRPLQVVDTKRNRV